MRGRVDRLAAAVMCWNAGIKVGVPAPTCFRMLISRLICSTMPLRTSASLSSTLMATASPVSLCCPYLTLA